VEGIARRGIREVVADASGHALGEREGVTGRHRIALQRHAARRHNDLLIACIAAMILIFAIMLIITRSVVAAWSRRHGRRSLGTLWSVCCSDDVWLGVQWIVLRCRS